MPAIKSISHRKILNSHVKFTNEFVILFEDGSSGYGASPQGETISIYEDKKNSVDAEAIVRVIKNAGYLGRTIEQTEFDHFLQQSIPVFGMNNTYGLSLAFFNASRQSQSLQDLFGERPEDLINPFICFNILNGGWHAYTNPVLSDFSEYILVARSSNLEEMVEYHNEIQSVVRERLTHLSKTTISGNSVNCFDTHDNRKCIEFLLEICEECGLADQFDLMIDASAGDLWSNQKYRLAVTNSAQLSSEEFYDYWMGLIRQYPLKFLEDPFHEQDFDNWQRITTSQDTCYIIGDNLYSTDAERIRVGAARPLTHGVIIKPNQAGTVTAVQQAIGTTQKIGQIAITSHRSISTESTFLSALTCLYGIKYIKIGPLATDYSSVIRLNEIIRLTGQNSWQ